MDPDVERGDRSPGLKQSVDPTVHAQSVPMGEPDRPSAPNRLLERLDGGTETEVKAWLDRLHDSDAADRKRTLRAIRNEVQANPGTFQVPATPLAAFLTDPDRAVRLTTAKLFVTLAKSDPSVVVPAVDALADRLADDEEFYYVRARAAEALGYTALECPDAVTDPEVLADLRVGLSFDEQEVKQKLAKAVAFVALGDPGRLRHQVDSLADHLDADDELVRYHLCTTLVAVGSERPAKLSAARDALEARLDDENPYVRGRAAEAIGVLASVSPVETAPTIEDVEPGTGDAKSFVTKRLQFARGDRGSTGPDEVGTVESIRRGTEEVVEAMTAPETDGACPHCGLTLPAGGPPMCPRCGAPY